MRVAFITTVHHNVGDDFVREGIWYLVRKVRPGARPFLIHKHVPLTARLEWEWFYRSGCCGWLDRQWPAKGTRLTELLDQLPTISATDKILRADVVIQSGAPVYWYHDRAGCERNEWYGPLITRRWRRVGDRVPLLNLAAGSCQQYDSDGAEILASPLTVAHIREFYHACVLTTVRDRLSHELLGQLGLTAELLPCTSIFARHRLGHCANPPEYTVLNYMPGGGHYDFDGQIDNAQWEKTFTSFAQHLHREENCLLVCHNRNELKEAERLLPGIPRFYSTNWADYLTCYSRARYGILNRVHGSFAVASFGRPAFTVGSDSRARMTELIGLPNAFVGETTEDTLWTARKRLQEKASEFHGTFGKIAQKTEDQYLALLDEVLPTRV